VSQERLPGSALSERAPARRSVLEQIRIAFPRPTSDRVHDAYFVFSIPRAFDQMDAMKSDAPVLGDAGLLVSRAGAQPTHPFAAQNPIGRSRRSRLTQPAGQGEWIGAIATSVAPIHPSA